VASVTGFSNPITESLPSPKARQRALHPGPYPPDLGPVEALRGVKRWFLSYGVSSCLPDPHRLAVPVRPVVVRAAPTLPCASTGQAALSFGQAAATAQRRSPSTSARSSGASWRAEKSFRMPNHDLQARPIYHHQRASS
jgi:hypothetical protein